MEMEKILDACGVLNRDSGKQLLEERLKALLEGETAVVVLLDLDKLTEINDRFGVLEGDFILKTVCGYLKAQLEEPDFLFRLSGDKFILAFFGKKEREITKRVLEWRRALEHLAVWKEKGYSVSFSFGICPVRSGRYGTVNELFSHADERMYEEKLRRRKNEALARSEGIPLRIKQEKLAVEYPAEYFYDAIVRSTDNYVYICNMKTGRFQYTPALVETFGLPGEVVDKPLKYWKKIVHPEDWPRFYKSNMEVGENKRDAHLVEFRARDREGEYQWIRCRGYMIRDEYGEPALFAGIMHRMGRQNEIDPLTQLFNHQMFDKWLRREVKSRVAGSLAVMILGVDNFRQINEMYSRAVGDRILYTAGHKIQSVLPANAGLFRLESDRMGIVMGNASSQEVEELYGEIRRQLRLMKEWKSYKLEVRVSAGCAFFPQDGKTEEELYQYADYALQYAKEQGKDRLAVFTEEILKEKNQQLGLIKRLRDSMNQDFRGFSFHYQPQVAADTGKIIGAEALCRFQDQEGHSISPTEFIPVMETEGLVYDLGLWGLRKSLRAAREWIRIQPDFTISVNASTLQLMDDSYIGDVQKILREEEFSPRNLVIELTESNAVQNLDIYRDKYKCLQEMGIRVAMDDFGTGYSSLEFLKGAPIDLVKIDRAFVRGINHSRFDSAFVAFIVEICHDVNLTVCQEGVETQEEYEILRKMGVDCVQGYYFGKPMPEEAFTELLLDMTEGKGRSTGHE